MVYSSTLAATYVATIISSGQENLLLFAADALNFAAT
jgi:hypothetical protein